MPDWALIVRRWQRDDQTKQVWCLFFFSWQAYFAARRYGFHLGPVQTAYFTFIWGTIHIYMFGLSFSAPPWMIQKNSGVQEVVRCSPDCQNWNEWAALAGLCVDGQSVWGRRRQQKQRVGSMENVWHVLSRHITWHKNLKIFRRHNLDQARTFFGGGGIGVSNLQLLAPPQNLGCALKGTAKC